VLAQAAHAHDEQDEIAATRGQTTHAQEKLSGCTIACMAKPSKSPPRDQLDPDDAAHLRLTLKCYGVAPCARHAKVGPFVVLAAAAGLPIRREAIKSVKALRAFTPKGDI